MSPILAIVIALSYIGLLFLIAWWADRCAAQGRSLVASPVAYSLSLAVFCTAWTFYGSVGRAAESGPGFLPVYLGPTLAAILFSLVLRRLIEVVRAQRVTSIADFIASRYGKSRLLGALVTVLAVLGIMPYIAIQLKAVLLSYAALTDSEGGHAVGLSVALLLALFAIVFGTRHIDSSERHEGIVAAVAFESLTKLLAFLAVGIYAVFFLFDGPFDLFGRIGENEALRHLVTLDEVPGGYSGWFTLTLVSMAAFICLPRQFQALVVENVNPDHLRTASWLFPLYLLLINLFVLPVALAGLLTPGAGQDPDLFVLTLPLAEAHTTLAVLVFLGGISAATGMVIVETVALSTMVCNDLVLPLMLRRLDRQRDIQRILLRVRRLAILAIVFLGYLYLWLIGNSHALVAMGLVSFAAAMQFAPAIVFGLYWPRAHRIGALLGLCSGALVWFWTLVVPAFIRSGWLPTAWLLEGPAGLLWLHPEQLFGLTGLDSYSHAVFWSMLFNIGGLIAGSLVASADAIEQREAREFTDPQGKPLPAWRSQVSFKDLRALLNRFLGDEQAERALAQFSVQRPPREPSEVSPELLHYAERQLAGIIGAASARVVLRGSLRGRQLDIDDVMQILDETSQVIEYSHRLEVKSRQLEQTSAELLEANERLRELDRLKDEFVSTVTHELRTPLTSIRAFGEILQQNVELDTVQRQSFIDIIVREAERLTRLINQVLDLARLEAGQSEWNWQALDLRELVRNAVQASHGLYQENRVELSVTLPEEPLPVCADADRLTQLLINLLGNAVKFVPNDCGWVKIHAQEPKGAEFYLRISDNGPGIEPAQREAVFDKFHQVSNPQQGKPAGTGLGLAICRHIVERHDGRIWVEASECGGACFVVALPRVS